MDHAIVVIELVAGDDGWSEQEVHRAYPETPTCRSFVLLHPDLDEAPGWLRKSDCRLAHPSICPASEAPVVPYWVFRPRRGIPWTQLPSFMAFSQTSRFGTGVLVASQTVRTCIL
jgi:hypothetical protein